MGKEKDKKPLFGGIFQKFFKPSAKAEAKKKKEHHLTVQRSIPYLEMGRDGICRVEEHLYSKTVRFYDINYQLAQNEDKNTIFESWCDFLNYFDSSIRFQLSFINHKSGMSEYNKVIQIEPQHDQFDDVRMEYAQMLKQQLARGNNGLVRTKYITFSILLSSKKSMARAARALRSAAQNMQSGSMSWVCRSPLEIRFGTTPKTKHFCPGKMSAAESISFCSRESTHQSLSWMQPVAMLCMNTQKP